MTPEEIKSLKFGDRVVCLSDNNSTGTVMKCSDLHNVHIIFDYPEDYPIENRDYENDPMKGGSGLHCFVNGCIEFDGNDFILIGQTTVESRGHLQDWYHRNWTSKKKVDIAAIAKELYNISWQAVQFDDPMENMHVADILKRIENNLTAKQGLRLILKVLEVKSLMIETDFTDENNPFRDMHEFKNIETNIDEYPTDTN